MPRPSIPIVPLALALSLLLAPRPAVAVPICDPGDDGYPGLFPATGECGDLDFPEITCEPNRRLDATLQLGSASPFDNGDLPLDDRLTLASLCDVALYPAATFLPAPGGWCTPSSGTWPSCVSPGDEPDRGYRYPLLEADPAGRPYQIPAHVTPGDWWPVCVTPSAAAVVSDPGSSSCPPDHVELGRCIAAGHYYEKMASASRPAERFYSFVLSHRDCAPREASEDSLGEFVGYCAHDVVSAVDACMRNCEQYFGSLRYVAGSDWTIGSPPAGDTTLVTGTDHTILTQCRAMCGPPYDDEFVCTDTNDLVKPGCSGGDFTVHDTPPWTSRFSDTGKTVAEKSNHWHFVQYGREWNPNTNLDNWLRSYSVNRDKPTAPAGECVELVNLYCSTQGANQAACQQRLLDDPTFDPRLPPEVSPPDGFCGIFYRGSIVCPDTCHATGADADNPLPRNRCGFDLPRDFSDEKELVPEHADEIDTYMQKFTCAGSSARCEIPGCSASDFAETGCREIAFVYPKQGSVAQPWPFATLDAMHVYLHTRYGEIVTEPAVQGTWKLTSGGPAAKKDLIACGHFELDGRRFKPVQDPTCDAPTVFPLSLEVDVVHRFEATFEAPDGSDLDPADVKIKRPAP